MNIQNYQIYFSLSNPIHTTDKIVYIILLTFSGRLHSWLVHPFPNKLSAQKRARGVYSTHLQLVVLADLVEALLN